MQSAVERWQEMQDVRARQMDAAFARLGRTTADFWDRRARHYHRSTKETVYRDPFYQRLRSVVTLQTSVLDVGAGTGRFALALAPQVQHISAVEPNASMLQYLRQDAQELGLTNITYVPTTWQDAPADLQADIVVCSHVLYPIRDIVPFLEKLLGAARQACYIYMRAQSLDSVNEPLWKHFHSEPRHFSPGYIHALDVLYEMGIYADVEVVQLPQSLRFFSLDNAVEEMLEQLILPRDEQTTAELRTLLSDWLVERDGELVPPVQSLACAVMKIVV